MKYYSKGHEKECKALKDKCNFCGEMKNVINFPKKPISTRYEVRKQHIAGAVTEPDFWDEAGDTMYKTNAHMLSTSRGQEKHIIQFNITFE